MNAENELTNRRILHHQHDTQAGAHVPPMLWNFWIRGAAEREAQRARAAEAERKAERLRPKYVALDVVHEPETGVELVAGLSKPEDVESIQCGN